MIYLFNDKLRITRDTSHKCCCSLGIHVDLKHKYITLHLLWYCILIGDIKCSEFETQEENDEFNELLARHVQEQDDFCKLHRVHPIVL